MGNAVWRVLRGIFGFCIGGFLGFWAGAAIVMAFGGRGLGEDQPTFFGAVLGLVAGAILGVYLLAEERTKILRKLGYTLGRLIRWLRDHSLTVGVGRCRIW